MPPPLPLWQVLKEEYESFHLQESLSVYLKAPSQFASALRNAPVGDALARHIKAKLSEAAQTQLTEWNGAAPLPDGLENSLAHVFYHSLMEDANLILNDAPNRADQTLTAAGLAETQAQLRAAPLRDPDKIAQVNHRLLTAAYPHALGYFDDPRPDKETCRREDDRRRLAGVHRYIRRKDHAAVCLSGGGIRSATFNLGILQGLARHRLLGKFHYLSTVSGGGFVGGWLSAWISRHPQGVEGVVKELSSPPTSPIDPDPKPLKHLRAFGNYLSPKIGLLSADTWTMVTTVIRNMLLNWLVFVPVIVAALLLPRFWMRLVLRNTEFDISETVSLVIGSVGAIVGLTYIGLNLPSFKTNYQLGRFRWFLTLCLAPLVISAMAFTVYWARLYQDGQRAASLSGWWPFVPFLVALVLIPWVIGAVARIRAANDKLYTFGLGVVATFLIAAAMLVSGSLIWYVATSNVFSISIADSTSNSRFIYACFAVPLFLMLLLLAGTLISGFTSRYTTYEDQEWWARIGAWFLIVILGWAVVHLLVIYGPLMLLGLGKAIGDHGLKPWRWNWEEIAKAVGTITGVVSGAVALFGGFTAKTPANAQEAKQAGPASKALGALTSLVAPLFVAFLVILVSLGTTWLLNPLVTLYHGTNESLPLTPTEYLALVANSPIRLLAVVCLIIAVIGVAMGRLINTNRFSLHYFWRNRIVRAYLGASNRNRRENPFTGFDPNDNVQMWELRPQQPGAPKQTTAAGPTAPVAAAAVAAATAAAPRATRLFHVLNIALNLVGGSRLDWQERKAESFTVSPLHCGSFWPELGYRKSYDYGGQPYAGRQGISLGTAVAISGAFASPNMGYMMSSPVVRFLMTLFNIRFGWWLGNPGEAGDTGRPGGKTFDRDSPRYSVLPIFQEALGMTSDESPYVYLSDGGHFENFGLYEMVLRRCRFIVVSDASTDPAYGFSSLGQSIRQIRVDLGVPIDMQEFSISGPGVQASGKYCAVGTIRYSCVDGNPTNEDGVLVYIKPALTGDEPRDILNYAGENSSFPQEFIGDQWFSESQFESYRALGSHIVNELCSGGKRDPITGNAPDHSPNGFDFDKFKRNVEEYINSIRMESLDEGVYDVVLREELKRSVQGVQPPGISSPSALQERVRGYVERMFRSRS